jgi:hypothetical protein
VLLVSYSGRWCEEEGPRDHCGDEGEAEEEKWMAGKLGSVSCGDRVCVRGGPKLFIWEDCHGELDLMDTLDVVLFAVKMEVALGESLG